MNPLDAKLLAIAGLFLVLIVAKLAAGRPHGPVARRRRPRPGTHGP